MMNGGSTMHGFCGTLHMLAKVPFFAWTPAGFRVAKLHTAPKRPSRKLRPRTEKNTDRGKREVGKKTRGLGAPRT